MHMAVSGNGFNSSLGAHGSEGGASTRIPLMTVFAAASLSGALTPTVHAAEEQGAIIQEIVVTARKRQESAQDIPESITAVSAEVIERAGIKSINDIQFIATGVNLNARADETPNVVMRGVGSFGNIQGVGFYVDDVQIYTGMTELTEDLERIEVLKGPQGTLYGGSNIGGAIKYVLKQPEYQWGGQMRLQGGSFGAKSFAGAITGPVVDETLAFRASAYVDRSDGYMFNTFIGDEMDRKKEYGARVALRADPTENFSATLSLRASRLDQDGFNLYYQPVDATDYRRTVSYDEPLHIERDIVAPTLTMDWTLGAGHKVTSISAYQRSKIPEFVIELDFSADPANRINADVEALQEVWSQELRILSPDDGRRLSWLAGVYAVDRKSSGPTTINIFDPAGEVAASIRLESEDRTKQYAAFGSASYRLAERWQASGGIRVNYAENSVADLVANLRGSADETSVLPKISLQYEPRPDAMVYLTYSQGLEPGSVATVGTDFRPYEAETTRNYELGMKGEFMEQTLRLNLAAFYVDYENRLFESWVADGGTGVPEEFIRNIGDSHNLGVEAELAWRATRGLTLSAGVSVIEARWEKGVLYFDEGTGEDIDLGARDLAPPFVPDYTATVSADWNYPLSADVAVNWRIDAAFMGKSYWDVQNANAQEAYSLVNASVGIEWRKWNFSVQGRNLFDTEYNNEYLDALYSGLPTNLATRGQPRMILFSLNGTF